MNDCRTPEAVGKAAAKAEPKAVLLSGRRGAGKTTLCLFLAESLAGAGGVVCPGIFDKEGVKTGFRCRCLQTGESWDLGSVRPDCAAPSGGGQMIGKYSLYEAGIKKAIECIDTSLRTPGGVTIIDEIGPLELLKGGGFAPVLPLLRGAGDMLIVVRHEFVKSVLPLIQGHDYRCFDLNLENRTPLRSEITSFFAASS